MKKKYKILLGGIVVIIFAAAAAFSMLKPRAVETETVMPGRLETELTIQGTLLPRHSEIINAVANGAVKEMPHPAGTVLGQGEAILTMGYESQADLELSREQYRQQLTSARQTYDRLFGENGTAAAAVSAAESSFNLAEKNYQNGKVLAADGSVAQLELDGLADQYNQAKHVLSQAKEENSESNRNYYKQLITSYEKQLETLEQVVNPGEITMPYDGVIWELYPQAGAYVTSNQPVAKIYQPGDMKIEASLLTEDAMQLEPGQTASVRYADGTAEEAQVRFISTVAGQTLSTIGMEENRCMVELTPVKVPEGAGAGQQVDITCFLVAAESVLTVPSSALVPVTDGNAVYVIRNQKAVLTDVETGKKSGGRVELVSGVSEGDVVVADPYGDEVKEGSRLYAGGAEG